MSLNSEAVFKGILYGQERGIDSRDKLQPVASLRPLVPEDGVLVWDLMCAGQVHSAAVLLSQHGCWGLDHLVLWRRCYTRRSMMLYLTLKKLDFTDNLTFLPGVWNQSVILNEIANPAKIGFSFGRK